jgi:hypothetical protein
MFVAGYHPSFTPGIMFLIDKYTGKIEIGKKNNGITELLGRLKISNTGESTEFTCFENRIRFTNRNGDAKIIEIPYEFRLSLSTEGLLFHKPGDILNYSRNTSPNQLIFSFGMTFQNDGTNLIITKPGDPTKGVKIPWETL